MELDIIELLKDEVEYLESLKKYENRSSYCGHLSVFRHYAGGIDRCVICGEES